MTQLPKFYSEGSEITAQQAALICREIDGIDNADLIAIFKRAVYGEDEAREEFFDLSEIEIIG